MGEAAFEAAVESGEELHPETATAQAMRVTVVATPHLAVMG
jgi:hypothetical protein